MFKINTFIMFLVVVFILLVAFGTSLIIKCRSETEQTSRQFVGLVISAQPVQTSFNESIKTIVHTTGGSFILRGTQSVIKNDSAFVCQYKNSHGSFLCTDSRDKCPTILGF